MKNQELDELTGLAAKVAHAIPQLTFDGRDLLDPRGNVVEPSALLTPLYAAREHAKELHEALLNTPRRKPPGATE